MVFVIQLWTELGMYAKTIFFISFHFFVKDMWPFFWHMRLFFSFSPWGQQLPPYIWFIIRARRFWASAANGFFLHLTSICWMRIGFLDKAYLLVTSQTDEPDPETFNKHTCQDWLQCPYANLKYIYCYWRHNWRQIQRFLPSQTEMM